MFDEILSCLDSDDEGASSNPFADDMDSGLSSRTYSTNPFEDDADATADDFSSMMSSKMSSLEPIVEYEDVEEWIDEEVTDNEEDQLQSPRFGNALNKFSFAPSLDNEFEAISLASEASNQTPLHLAVWHKHENIVKQILEFRIRNLDRVNLDAKNSFDQTPFALSLWMGLSCCEDLLKAGSNINDCNSAGECLLQQAIMHQDSSSALFLLDRNADFSFRSIDGDSCLMSAIKRHLPLVVDALCIRGADMSQTDKNSNFPIWVALEGGQEDIASILVKHGCDVNGWHISPREGYFQTLLHRAIKVSLKSLSEHFVFLIEENLFCRRRTSQLLVSLFDAVATLTWKLHSRKPHLVPAKGVARKTLRDRTRLVIWLLELA